MVASIWSCTPFQDTARCEGLRTPAERVARLGEEDVCVLVGDEAGIAVDCADNEAVQAHTRSADFSVVVKTRSAVRMCKPISSGVRESN